MAFAHSKFEMCVFSGARNFLMQLHENILRKIPLFKGFRIKSAVKVCFSLDEKEHESDREDAFMRSSFV